MLDNHPQSNNHTYKENFKYTHNNPYHHRLENFSDFILRDDEAEKFKGKWSQEIFKNQHPIHLEIGSGYGHFMQQFLEIFTSTNYVGLDFRFKRTFNLSKKLHTNYSHIIKRFRFLRAKAQRVSYIFQPGEIEQIYIFFPDPWPKNKHKKNRLIQQYFIKQCHQLLKENGKIFIKTDHAEYFNFMLKELALFQQSTEKPFTIEFCTHNLNHDLEQITCSQSKKIMSLKTKFEKLFNNQEIKTNALILKKG